VSSVFWGKIVALTLRSLCAGVSVGVGSVVASGVHAADIDLYGVLDTGLSYVHVSRDASPGLQAYLPRALEWTQVCKVALVGGFVGKMSLAGVGLPRLRLKAGLVL